MNSLFDPDMLPEPFDAEPLPPAVESSRTSQEAACAIEPRAATLRRAVLECIRAAGDGGRTDEEVQDELGMNPSTERPRRIECERMGLVRDSGRTRKTKSGRNAVVWVAAGKG